MAGRASAVLALLAPWGLAFPTSPYHVKESHPVPASWTAVRSANKDQLIHLQIGLTQRNQGLVEKHLLEVSDPDHVRYGQHLSAAEIDAMTAPAAESVEKVESWLSQNGVTPASHSASKDWIHIVVPVSKAEELLKTKYKTFRHHDGSEIDRAPEWSLPIFLHEHIDVVQPTTSFFRLKANEDTLTFDPEAPDHSLEWFAKHGEEYYNLAGANTSALCNVTFTTPNCVRTLYGTIDYTPKAGNRNRVGITNYLNETSNYNDTKQFLHQFRPEGEAGYKFPITIIANASNNQGPYTQDQLDQSKNAEGNLDAQWVLGMSWPVPLYAWNTGGSPPFIPDLATTTNTNEPYLVWLNYVLSQRNLPQVISTSYGDDEQTVPESYARRVCAGLAQLGARGITVLFSSGDYGVGKTGTCKSTKDGQDMFLPAFPAGCPWVTTVGGTANFNPETAVTRYASGGGFANYFPTPAYQKNTIDAYIKSLGGKYDGLYNKTGRGYPDVAAQGNRDVIVYNSRVRTIGGTSASSPTMAGVLTLVNDALIAAGKPPLGFINPMLYKSTYKTFTDVTIGSSFGCGTDGFPATTGWDAVTGFGTPNFKKLLDAVMKAGPRGYGNDNE
ncbi:tripeptidyl peptidase-like protein [Piedraia hortae CBS 480.64]|uniref:tripeptidyl-peptidase II n=1 Tax=Piedraia hortae CBS 480.64 TaxID=1314780 RepID=A0A6A7C583_9PEZI|nr:tripeptidyl peptidase-like protein [Piedraia hortae CBS 480.64]